MEYFFDFELEYDDKSPLGHDVEADLQVLLSEARLRLKDFDYALIKNAFYYCVEKHYGTFRVSGKPYYTHPLNVALILLREFPLQDSASVAACLLHDIIEDSPGQNKQQIAMAFNNEIAEIVEALTKIKHSETHKLNDKAQTYRKLFLALVKDIRVILIKLADRLHNIRTLHYLSPEKQSAISRETLNFYTPLARRLGLSRIKMELENLSFYFSDRSAYEAIRSELNVKRRDFITYIQMFSDHIQKSLNAQNIKHILSVVHKHEYEIFNMMQDGKSISDIDNFYSMVIILQTNEVWEAYRAHGVLANAFNTISFIDYIANPKLDWFKALKTELYGPDGKRVEIIIRTEEMEKIAEEGFASKYSLKIGRTRALEFSDDALNEWGEWMQDIIERHGDDAAQLIWDSIKVNLFDSDLTVFTRSGESKRLPKGASIIDFAFSIAKEMGLHLISAKVNGVIKELSYELQSGDQIEIITSPNVTPQPEWQNCVVSHRAVVSLHKFFSSQLISATETEKQSENFDVKLRIKGEARNGLLAQISDAIGKENISRIILEPVDNYFHGLFTFMVPNNDRLNYLFANLFSIKGVRGVEKVEEIQQ